MLPRVPSLSVLNGLGDGDLTEGIAAFGDFPVADAVADAVSEPEPELGLAAYCGGQPDPVGLAATEDAGIDVVSSSPPAPPPPPPPPRAEAEVEVEVVVVPFCSPPPPAVSVSPPPSSAPDAPIAVRTAPRVGPSPVLPLPSPPLSAPAPALALAPAPPSDDDDASSGSSSEDESDEEEMTMIPSKFDLSRPIQRSALVSALRSHGLSRECPAERELASRFRELNKRCHGASCGMAMARSELVALEVECARKLEALRVRQKADKAGWLADVKRCRLDVLKLFAEDAAAVAAEDARAARDACSVVAVRSDASYLHLKEAMEAYDVTMNISPANKEATLAALEADLAKKREAAAMEAEALAESLAESASTLLASDGALRKVLVPEDLLGSLFGRSTVAPAFARAPARAPVRAPVARAPARAPAPAPAPVARAPVARAPAPARARAPVASFPGYDEELDEKTVDPANVPLPAAARLPLTKAHVDRLKEALKTAFKTTRPSPSSTDSEGIVTAEYVVACVNSEGAVHDVPFLWTVRNKSCKDGVAPFRELDGLYFKCNTSAFYVYRGFSGESHRFFVLLAKQLCDAELTSLRALGLRCEYSGVCLDGTGDQKWRFSAAKKRHLALFGDELGEQIYSGFKRRNVSNTESGGSKRQRV